MKATHNNPPIPAADRRPASSSTRSVLALIVSLLNLTAQLILLIGFAFTVFAPLIFGMVLSLLVAVWTLRMSRRARADSMPESSRVQRGLQIASIGCSWLSTFTVVAMLIWVATVCPHEQNC